MVIIPYLNILFTVLFSKHSYHFIRRDEKSIIRDNIIGNNFLLENKLKLVFDPSKGISYLESE
jgi:hypothetical protein